MQKTCSDDRSALTDAQVSRPAALNHPSKANFNLESSETSAATTGSPDLEFAAEIRDVPTSVSSSSWRPENMKYSMGSLDDKPTSDNGVILRYR
jgi:hypothetical protein